jgi:hypothetical protein
VARLDSVVRDGPPCLRKTESFGRARDETQKA